jgi:hypothetical protein
MRRRSVRERVDEPYARNILRAVLGARVEIRDDGSAPGLPDLEVMWDDRPPTAVEVVRSADQVERQGSAEWSRHASGGYRASWLKRSWLLGVMSGQMPTFKDLPAEAEPWLAVLEGEDVTTATPIHWNPWLRGPTAEALGRLSELRITDAISLSPRPGGLPEISINLGHGYTTPISTEPVVDAVEQCLAEHPRKAAKLAAWRSPDNHVFVILDHSRPTPLRAWQFWPEDCGLPQRAPALPEPVRQVWVAPFGSSVVWMWAADYGKWRAFEAHLDGAVASAGC